MYAIVAVSDDDDLKITKIEYEEMVEILAAIRDTPVRGNECFDSAKKIACEILHKMPSSNY
jgi:hypothetical protein